MCVVLLPLYVWGFMWCPSSNGLSTGRWLARTISPWFLSYEQDDASCSISTWAYDNTSLISGRSKTNGFSALGHRVWVCRCEWVLAWLRQWGPAHPFCYFSLESFGSSLAPQAGSFVPCSLPFLLSTILLASGIFVLALEPDKERWYLRWIGIRIYPRRQRWDRWWRKLLRKSIETIDHDHMNIQTDLVHLNLELYLITLNLYLPISFPGSTCIPDSPVQAHITRYPDSLHIFNNASLPCLSHSPALLQLVI